MLQFEPFNGPLKISTHRSIPPHYQHIKKLPWQTSKAKGEDLITHSSP